MNAKTDLLEIKKDIHKVMENVALLEEEYDTQDWHRDTKWLMADLNAVLCMLHTTHDLCDQIIQDQGL
jgi:hypothetical protein